MARRTRPLIEQAFRTSEGFTSARELHELISDRGERVGLATIYRELRRMLAAGSLDVLHDHRGEARYRWCGAGHHHHLVCGRCGRTAEIDGHDLERWIESVAASADFADVEHVVELIGTCRQCR